MKIIIHSLFWYNNNKLFLTLLTLSYITKISLFFYLLSLFLDWLRDFYLLFLMLLNLFLWRNNYFARTTSFLFLSFTFFLIVIILNELFYHFISLRSTFRSFFSFFSCFFCYF